MSKDIAIGRKRVGDLHPTYFIADIAANHDGDLERAKHLIHLAAEAGADAAKFQNFAAETIVSDHGFKSLGGQQSHQSTWKKSVFQVYKEASIPLGWTPALKEACAKAGIDYFTAPYDLAYIDPLLPHVCAWKLGSGDITWHAEIEAMAKTGKPLLMATGAAAMDEVRAAVAVARRHTDQIVLMQCNTNYTASLDNLRHVALNVLKIYAVEFPDLVLGLSDHTPGHATVLGAVALGARSIEKHFTDDNAREGPDHPFSMTPATWREMVARTRELESALGDPAKRVAENEKDTVVVQRRCLRAGRDIRAGERLRREWIDVLRPSPAGSIQPYELEAVLGTSAAADIPAGEALRWTMLRD